MGADLITAVVYHPTTKKLDWDAGAEALKNLSEDDTNLNFLENFMMIDCDDDGNVDMEAVRDWLSSAVGEVKDSIEGYDRNVNSYRLLDHTIYITGDMSWGDCPELVDSYSILYTIPTVAKAIGFTIED